MEYKIEKCVDVGKGKMLNIAGRLTLVQASLRNIPLYMMSFTPSMFGQKREMISLESVLYGKVMIIRRNVT